MPERKLLKAVTIARGSKVTKNSKGGEIHRPAERYDLKAGTVFDFTEKEIENIEARQPGTFATTMEVDVETGEPVAAKSAGKAGETKPAAKTAAKGKGKDDGL